jgi:gastrin-releasing peptide receptor
MKELRSESNEIDATENSVDETVKKDALGNTSLEWPDIVAGQQKLVGLPPTFLQKAVKASKDKEENASLDISVSHDNLYLLDDDFWNYKLELHNKFLKSNKSANVTVEHVRFLLYTANPPMMAIVFVIGITGNGLLLTIFIRRKERRTFQKFLLINLTVADCLTLFTNVLVEYFYFRSSWPLVEHHGKLFIFWKYMFNFISIYSLVVLSVERFMVFRQCLSGAMPHEVRKTTCLVVATVWAFGVILSLPRALLLDIKLGTVDPTVFVWITADFVVICVVPIILAADFTGLAADGIRRCVRSIPGEGAGIERLRHSLIVSSANLFALAAISLLCHTPYYLFCFLCIHDCIMTSPEHTFTILFVMNYLRYVNCCLNPLALFVMKKDFRSRLNDIVCCGRKK